MVQDPVRTYIRAPEGKYQQHNHRGQSCNFNAFRPTRLTFATAEGQNNQTQKYIIYNSSDVLNIIQYAAIDKASDVLFMCIVLTPATANSSVHRHQISRSTYATTGYGTETKNNQERNLGVCSGELHGLAVEKLFYRPNSSLEVTSFTEKMLSAVSTSPDLRHLVLSPIPSLYMGLNFVYFGTLPLNL